MQVVLISKKQFDEEFQRMHSELDLELMTQLVAAARSHSSEDQLRQLHRKTIWELQGLKSRLEQASL